MYLDMFCIDANVYTFVFGNMCADIGVVNLCMEVGTKSMLASAVAVTTSL